MPQGTSNQRFPDRRATVEDEGDSSTDCRPMSSHDEEITSHDTRAMELLNQNAGATSSSTALIPTAPGQLNNEPTDEAPRLDSEARLQPTLYNQLQAPTTPILAGEINANTLAATNPTTTAMSTTYRGDPRLRDNYSAAIPPNHSTSLFIKDLPCDITVVQILERIRSTGKVYSLPINPPVPLHYGCAAKIGFFTRKAAEKFYSYSRGGFWVGGHHRATVVWNRVLVAEHVGGRWDEASRVVIVRGNRELVSMAAVASIVHKSIRMYDLALVCETDYTLVDGGFEVEVHFGSFRAQAHSAYFVLNRAFHGKGVKISYGTDPCA